MEPDLSRRDGFSIRPLATVPLGMLTTTRSLVRRRVAQSVMSSISPSWPAMRQVSPTRRVWLARIARPPKTFSRLFWAANASTRPPMPRPAIEAVTLTPYAESAMSATTTNARKRSTPRARLRVGRPAACP